MDSKLNPKELKRYNRHLILREFGMEGQLKLKESRILVVGAGGLGCPALLYLAAAGVGKIGVIDSDVVQESNLQRQILFTVHDIRENKAIAASNRLKDLNPLISITPYPIRLTSKNALDVIKDYDLVIDGTDNFPTRYLINDACVLLNKCLVYGSILEYEGQVAVFNIQNKNSHSSNYRDIFPTPPEADAVPNCVQAGVLGVLPGIIGSIQANEAIKILTGIGEVLSDKLLIIDSLSMEATHIKIKSKNTRSKIKELIDYDHFCNVDIEKKQSMSIKEITVQEFQQLQTSGTVYQLIDVRNPHEYEICNLAGDLIPLVEVPQHVTKINREVKVIIYCHSGYRSGQAIQWLEKNHRLKNLYNLKGGIHAWACEIDPTMPTY